MELEPLGELGQRRLRRLAAGLGDEADDVRLVREPAVGLERVDRRELPAGRPDGPLEVRRLRVEDAVELAAQRPRDLARLELEQRPARPDPAQERARRPRRSSRSRRRGRAAAATTPAARRRRAGRRGPAPRPAATTNSRCVRPPARLSEPRARNRPRSHAIRQCSAAASQSNGRRAGPSSRRRPAPGRQPDARAARPTPRAPVGARPEPATSARRSHGRDGSIAASSARRAATRSRSERVTLGSPGHAAPRAVQAARRDARAPAAAALALEHAR